MIQFDKAKQILDTLPISFYLKRRIDAELQNCEYSYCDVFNNKIAISFNQIEKANVDENNAESDIRCLLYHEVSHAFITPKKLMHDAYFYNEKDIDAQAIANVVEDERIETICADYYYDVDFDDFCRKINHFDESKKPQNAWEFFYNIVRFDCGPSDLVEKKNQLIDAYSYLKLSSTELGNYIKDIINLYKEAKARFNVSNTDSKKDETISDANVDDNSNMSMHTDDVCDNKSKKMQIDATIDDAIDDFNDVMNSLNDTTIYSTLSEIISKKKAFSKQNGSAINGYSGIFDVKSTVRNDYKFFVKQNRLGNVRRFTKIKMNLFVDCSGSFWRSQEKVNKMLFCLSLLEKQNPDFSFDLIKMTYNAKLAKKDERQIECSGCNDIQKEIFDIYNHVNEANKQNINVVLFDGNAFS